MKKLMKISALALLVSFTMSSCYTYTYNVGKGAQKGITVKEKNHYLLYGLAPIKTSNPVEMANGAEDYTVKVTHSFVDGLLNALTGGIYTPTTTKVTQ